MQIWELLLEDPRMADTRLLITFNFAEEQLREDAIWCQLMKDTSQELAGNCAAIARWVTRTAKS